MVTFGDLQSYQIDWSHPIVRGLVGYWLPSGSGMRSLVPGIGDGAPVNSGTLLSTPSGPAYGTTTATTGGYASVPANSKYLPTTGISIVHCGSVNATSNGYAFSVEGSSTGWGCYAYGTGSPHLFIRMADASGSWYDNSVTINNVNTPTQIALTFDGTNVNYYSDAAKFGFAAAGPIVESTNGLIFGGDSFGDTAVAGSTNYFGVWNRALTDAEIIDLKSDPYQFLVQMPVVAAQAIDKLSAAVTTPRPVATSSANFGWKISSAAIAKLPVGAASGNVVDYKATSATTLPKPVAVGAGNVVDYKLTSAVTTPRPVGSATATNAQFALHAAVTTPRPVGSASANAADYALHAELTLAKPVGNVAAFAVDYPVTVTGSAVRPHSSGNISVTDYAIFSNATALRPVAVANMNRALTYGSVAATAVRPIGLANVQDKVGLSATGSAKKPQAIGSASAIDYPLTVSGSAKRPVGAANASTVDYPITSNTTASKPVGHATVNEGAKFSAAVTLPKPAGVGSVGFNVAVFFFAQPNTKRPVGNAAVTSHPFNASAMVTTPRPLGVVSVKEGAKGSVAVTLSKPIALVRLAEVVKGSAVLTLLKPVANSIMKHGEGLSVTGSNPKPVANATAKRGEKLTSNVTLPRPVAAGAIRLTVFFTLGGPNPSTMVLGHNTLGHGVLGTTVYMPRPIALSNLDFVRNSLRSNNLILSRPATNGRFISIRNGLQVYGITPRPLARGQDIVVHNTIRTAVTALKPVANSSIKRGNSFTETSTAPKPVANAHASQTDLLRSAALTVRPTAFSLMTSVHNGLSVSGLLTRPVAVANVGRGNKFNESGTLIRPVANAKGTVIDYVPSINVTLPAPVALASVKRGNRFSVPGVIARPVANGECGHIPFDLFAKARTMRPVANITGQVVDYPVTIAGTLPRPILLTRIKSITGFHATLTLLRPSANGHFLHGEQFHSTSNTLARPVAASTLSFNTIVDSLRSNAVVRRPWAVALVNPGNLSYGLKRPIAALNLKTIDYDATSSSTLNRPVATANINYIRNLLSAKVRLPRPVGFVNIDDAGSKISVAATARRPVANSNVKYITTFSATASVSRPIALINAKYSRGLAVNGSVLKPIGNGFVEQLVGSKIAGTIGRPVAAANINAVNYKLSGSGTLHLIATGRMVAKDYIVTAGGQITRPVANATAKRGEKFNSNVTTAKPVANVAMDQAVAVTGNAKAVKPIALAKVFRPATSTITGSVIRPKAHGIIAENVRFTGAAVTLQPVAQGVLVPAGGTVAPGLNRMPIATGTMEAGTGLSAMLTMAKPKAEAHIFMDNGGIYLYSKPVLGRPVAAGSINFATTINRNPVGSSNLVTLPGGPYSTITVSRGIRVIN